MHSFNELIHRSTRFSLNTLSDVESKILKELETSGSTYLVKTLQMIQLQRAIIAIGSFSLLESILQDKLKCEDGFKEAKNRLIKSGHIELCNNFDNFICAINVLKHGRGRSYKKLISKKGSLPFKVKLPEKEIFNQGDVAEISTLIEINDSFILACTKVIHDVYDKTLQ